MSCWVNFWKHKNCTFGFSIISCHWGGTGCWNTHLLKTKACFSCIFNQHHGSWWPGDARIQGFNGIGPVYMEYFSLSTSRVRYGLFVYSRCLFRMGVITDVIQLWMYTEIQNYLLPYGSMGPTDHVPYGSKSIGVFIHWKLEKRCVPRTQVVRWVPFEF